MDRRNFLRMGSLAVLGSLAAPSLALPDTVRGALGGTDNKSAVAAAMKHFGVTEADLRKVLTAALEKGGDYADLYFEHSFNNAVALMDGKVNNCSSNIDFGMGVRVLAGDQSGYAYVEGVTLEEMLRAARTAARIASSGKAGKPVAFKEKTIERNRTVIYHTDMFITYFLVQLIGKDRNIFTVEISFKRMSDSFVQQDTRTTGCHHHREFTTFRFNGFKHDCCIIYNLASYHFDDIIRHKLKSFTIGTSGVVIFHTSVLFHNTESHIGYHRTVIIVSHTF